MFEQGNSHFFKRFIAKSTIFFIRPRDGRKLRNIYFEKNCVTIFGGLQLNEALHRFTGRIAVILFGLLALTIGIILSTIPWVDYIILRVSI